MAHFLYQLCTLCTFSFLLTSYFSHQIGFSFSCQLIHEAEQYRSYEMRIACMKIKVNVITNEMSSKLCIIIIIKMCVYARPGAGRLTKIMCECGR